MDQWSRWAYALRRATQSGSRGLMSVSSVGRKLLDAPVPLIVGSVVIGVLVGTGLVSLVWTPHDATAIDVANRLRPPGADGYLLGTDRLGRDVVSLLMVGARTSLFVSVVSATVSVIPGVLLGMLIAGSNRLARSTLTRLIDFAVAVPALLVALVLATVIGPGTTGVIVALIFAFVPGVARIVVGPARQMLAMEYVEAAFAYGRSRRFVLLRHVLPNIAPMITVTTALLLSGAILAEAGLSYLGLGAQPPTASWGRALHEAQSFMNVAPTQVIFPGVAITLAVVGFNLLGDGLRIILDPQRDGRHVRVVSDRPSRGGRDIPSGRSDTVIR